MQSYCYHMKPKNETSTKEKELRDGEKSVFDHIFKPLDLTKPGALEASHYKSQ